MNRTILAGVAAGAIGLTAPADAQSMAGMNMAGMAMHGEQNTPQRSKQKAAPSGHGAKRASVRATRLQAQRPPTKITHPAPHTMAAMPMSRAGPSSMAAMDMSAAHSAQAMAIMPGMAGGAAPHAPVMPALPSGTDLAPGNRPAPVAPMDHFADRTYGVADMAPARAAMMRDDGGRVFGKLLFNLAELQARDGRNGYRWDGEAWLGGDRNRFVLKSEGSGTLGKGVDDAEIQALYSRAVGPYFNLQGGLRHDLGVGPNRTYAAVGIEGLAPYMFETEATLFVSQKGDVLGRFEAWYDERLTQRLVLQPRVEFNFSAQNVPANRYGTGLVDAELGLRLRYEIRREFAPYVGLSWERKASRTADYARADGERVGGASFVAGVRFWF